MKNLSLELEKIGINTFDDACLFIKNLPYKRNLNKENILCVLEDNGGTCSTKHAFLKILADENRVENIELFLGIFMMNAQNTPKILSVLKKYNLQEMPEAHNYLKINGLIKDFTHKNSNPKNFVDDLMEEIEILPNQILKYKVDYHKKFLEKYVFQNPQILFSLKEFWQIREECIEELQK